MAIDYDLILGRAISALDPNTKEARYAVYDRARRMIAEMRPSETLSFHQITAELSALEEAIRRIEDKIAAGEGRSSGPMTTPSPATPLTDSRPARPRNGMMRALIISAAVLLLVGGGLYLYLTRGKSVTAPAVVEQPRPLPVEADKSPDNRTDLDPGVDGGSSAANLPFYYRRQTVFYRTTNAIGTVIIDASQKFLYVVQANNVAQRYGIGIGRDCAKATHLLHVVRKVEWPPWQASDALLRERPKIARTVPGGPGNPLGARAIYLDDPAYFIHGTNAPKTVGSLLASGCFRLVNDDVADLYDRVSLEAKVVTKN